MKFTETTLPDVMLIDLERFEDERGSFARSFCADEMAAAGIRFSVDQANISVNNLVGTVRGMHIQSAPSPEAKIVRCTRGRMFDVALDLRSGSAAYCQWFGVELTPDNGRALYIPPGCAHGFQSLEDQTEVHYLMHGKYDPAAATGVRHDDPAFGIEWPAAVTSISARDESWPDFDRNEGLPV
jgi:dTDP-4-dehydrorhamnose 3,5-epimerase